MPEACLFFVLTILDELGQILMTLLENLERNSIACLLRLLLTSHNGLQRFSVIGSRFSV